jgi:hypothetical protein
VGRSERGGRVDVIVAVDPGKITGLATWANNELVSWQEPTWYAVDRIWNTLEHLEVSVIVCESYTITASTLRKTRGENWSLESIGAIRWMSNRHGVEFVLQAPADAMRFMTDDKLRMLGWYRASIGGHANDAARHLGLYIANEDPPEFKRLLAVS